MMTTTPTTTTDRAKLYSLAATLMRRSDIICQALASDDTLDADAIEALVLEYKDAQRSLRWIDAQLATLGVR